MAARVRSLAWESASRAVAARTITPSDTVSSSGTAAALPTAETVTERRCLPIGRNLLALPAQEASS